MLNKKLKTIGSCLFLLILCFSLISCVTAADLGNDTDTKKNTNITIGPKTPGGLKTAIKNAEINATIYLKNGVYTGTNNRGISINKDINIVGLGSKVTINAQGKNQIFHIEKGKVSLKKLKLINGIGQGKKSWGGAIYSKSAFLNVKNCIFSNNKAKHSGGAIFCNGITSINNCTFTNNKAKFGGAIYGVTMNVANCIFTNNQGIIDAGAIDLSYSTIKKCTFKNNKARDGGAIISRYSTIEKSTFKNNKAAFHGGAIYCTQTIINKCTFINNQAKHSGGAIFENGDNLLEKSSMKVHNCIFTFNKAKDGGAIYFIGLSTVEKSTFKNNKANQKGGAIYNQAKSLKISDSIFKNNIAGKTYNTIFTKVTMTQENVTITPKDGTKVKK